GGAVTNDFALQRDEDGDAAAAGPADPAVERVFAGLAFEREHQPQAFFEQVGAVQSRIAFGDPGELGLLTAGEVLRVLPQRVAGSFECLGVPGGTACGAPVGRASSLVPGVAADFVERGGGPGDDV